MSRKQFVLCSLLQEIKIQPVQGGEETTLGVSVCGGLQTWVLPKGKFHHVDMYFFRTRFPELSRHLSASDLVVFVRCLSALLI